MPLTDAQIRVLQPRAARFLVSDGRGLSLDVLPSGVKSWMYRYRQDGAYGKVTLSRYPDLTLKAARDKRAELAERAVEAINESNVLVGKFDAALVWSGAADVAGRVTVRRTT